MGAYIYVNLSKGYLGKMFIRLGVEVIELRERG
jgi:hypothetical protein